MNGDYLLLNALEKSLEERLGKAVNQTIDIPNLWKEYPFSWL
jgi:hypothetical protein